MEVGVEDLDVGGRLDVAGGDVGRAAHVEAQGDRLVAVDVSTRSLRFRMMSVTSSVTPVDGVELVEGVVEADLRDGRAGDRRQQRAAQRVAERVAEAGLERADGEPLTVAVGLAEGLDGGALNDQHVRATSELGGRRGGLLGVELDDELLAHGHVDLLAQRQLADGDLRGRRRRSRATAGR